MYEKHDIEEMLEKYLKQRSQLEELESKIEKNKVLLKYCGKKNTESESEVIEEMSFNSPIISDMPKRKNK